MKDIEHVALNPLDESGVGKMIRVVRDKQVLLDSDLANLYGVETKYINRAVKRNTERFPDEFYFELTKEEFLRCQIGTLKSGIFMNMSNVAKNFRIDSELKNPEHSGELFEAIEEAKRLEADPKTKRYTDMDEMWADLDK